MKSEKELLLEQFIQINRSIADIGGQMETESIRLADWVRDNPGQLPDATHLLGLQNQVQNEIRHLGEIKNHLNDLDQS